MRAVGKGFFFEKKNQKTFDSIGLWVANVCPWPPKKSWMPACAGMTGEEAGGGGNPFILDFNRKELLPPDV
jgi:hypothetical protein